MPFWLILISLIALDIIWWRWADQKLRPLARARTGRILLAAFMCLQIPGFLLILFSRATWTRPLIPPSALAAVFIWHVLIAPVTMTLLAAGSFLDRVFITSRRLFRRVPADCLAVSVSSLALPADNPAAADDPPSDDDPPADPPLDLRRPTRRQILLAAAAAVPPLVTAGSLAVAMVSLDRFRIRRLTLNIPDLPPALDGLTVAHISDIHTGAFTPSAKLAAIVQQTNALNADLVLMTGDLIDYTLADLPAGLEMLRRLKSRYGLFACEGNHDLFEDREEFEDRVRSAGIPLLLDNSKTILINGHPVQILGLAYGAYRQRNHLIDHHMPLLLRHRRDDAFPILLSHHPHAFDPAAEAGIPLTLSGHTHGGQLMLTDSLGAGPLMFRYWSGLYTKGRSSLVVSNGVGNWFPLRINAPTEIAHLTLRRAMSGQ